MMNKFKRILALIMSVMMFTSNMPVVAFAAEQQNPVTVLEKGSLADGARIELKVGEEETISYYAVQNHSPGNAWNKNGLEVVNSTSESTNIKYGSDENSKIYRCVVTIKGKSVALNQNLSVENVINSEFNGTTNWNISYSVVGPTVSFAAGEGSGSMDSIQLSDIYYQLPENSFTAPDGKVFYGWAPNGDLMQCLKPGTQVSLSGDVEYTAVWGGFDITLNIERYYAGTNKGTYDKLYGEKEIVTITEHNTNYEVEAGTYENLSYVAKDNESPSIRVTNLNNYNGAQIDRENGKIVFNTYDVPLDDNHHGEVTIKFYFDPVYTVNFVVDLETAEETLPGVKSDFLHGNALLKLNATGDDFDEVKPETHVFGAQFSVESLHSNMPGYYDANAKNYYTVPGSKEPILLGSSLPPLGSTIYKVYNLKERVAVFQAAYNPRYFNEYNASFDGSGFWETHQANYYTGAHFGETVTVNWPQTTVVKYGPGEHGGLDYYKDATLYLWRYRANNQDDPVNQKTLNDTIAVPYTELMETPLVFTGGLKSAHPGAEGASQPYWYLLYKYDKPAKFSVKYFVDGDPVYQTEWLTPRLDASRGQDVIVKPMPALEAGKEYTSTKWDFVLIDFNDNKSEVNDNSGGVVTPLSRVTGVVGETFGMVDRHIEYYAYTKEPEQPEKINVTVIKSWNDGNDQYNFRPDSVSVQLKKDGTIVGDAVTLSAPNWTHTWSSLEKGAAYTVEETNMPAGYVPSSNSVQAEDGSVTCTITNTLITTDLEGTKNWVGDEGYETLTRPASIIVKAMKGETVVKSVEVTPDENGDWSWTIEDLPKFDAEGNEITYTVVEEAVPGYATSVVGTAITNTLKTI
ncbi:MAG: Cna B-type domain-containing protein, partial [Clostridia bacterium]|nr:Cna B-type domain-containing protein [Clostridia bacterium]